MGAIFLRLPKEIKSNLHEKLLSHQRGLNLRILCPGEKAIGGLLSALLLSRPWCSFSSFFIVPRSLLSCINCSSDIYCVIYCSCNPESRNGIRKIRRLTAVRTQKRQKGRENARYTHANTPLCFQFDSERLHFRFAISKPERQWNTA